MLAMASTASPEASMGKGPPPVSSETFVYPENTPMVWITQGKTEHAAYVLKEHKGRKFVKWVASQLTQWVDQDAEIKTELPRRRKGIRDSLNSDYVFPLASALSKAKKNDVKSDAKTPKKAPKRVCKKSSKGANEKKVAGNAARKKISASKRGKQLNLKHPIGTRVYKEFPPFGWFYGNVAELTEDGLYFIIYEDDDEETLNEKEVDAIRMDSSECMHDPHEVQDEIGENDIADFDDTTERVEQSAGENTASENQAQRRTGTTSTLLKIKVRLNEQASASHDDGDSSLQAIVSSPEELSAVLETDSQIDINEPVFPTTNHELDVPSDNVNIRDNTNLDPHDISKKRSSSLLYTYDTATTKKPRVTDQFLTTSVPTLRPKMTPPPKKSDNEETCAEKQSIPAEDILDFRIHSVKVSMEEMLAEEASIPVKGSNISPQNVIGEVFPPEKKTSTEISTEQMSAAEEALMPVEVGKVSSENGIGEVFGLEKMALVKVSAEEMSAAEEAPVRAEVGKVSSENGIGEAFPLEKKGSVEVSAEQMSAAEEASVSVKVNKDDFSSENGIGEEFSPEEKASLKISTEGMSAVEEVSIPVKVGNISSKNAIAETFLPEKETPVKISDEEISAARANDMVCPGHGSAGSSTPTNFHKGGSSDGAAEEVLLPPGMGRVASLEYDKETVTLAEKAGRAIPDPATITEETYSLAPLSLQRISAKIGEADRQNEFVEAYIEEGLEYTKDDNIRIVDGAEMKQDEVAAKMLDSSIMIAKAQSPVADKSDSDDSSHPGDAGATEATTTPESSAAHVALPSKAGRDSENEMNAPLTGGKLNNMASMASPSDTINTNEDRTRIMRYPPLVDKQSEESGASESKADDASTIAAQEFVSRHPSSVSNQSEVSMRDNNRPGKRENAALTKHSEAFDQCSSVDELVVEEEHTQSESKISGVHDQSYMKPPQRTEHTVAEDDSDVCAVEESVDSNIGQVSEHMTNEEIETFAAEAYTENAGVHLQSDIEREQASSPDQLQDHLSSVNSDSTKVVPFAETKFDSITQSAAPDNNAYVASDGDNIETEAPTQKKQYDLVNQAAEAVQHGTRATSSNTHSINSLAMAVRDETTPEHAIKQKGCPIPGNRSDNRFTPPIFSKDETRYSCPLASNSPVVTKSFRCELPEPSLISLNGSLLKTDRNQEQRPAQSATAPYFSTRETAITSSLDFGTESENELGVKSSQESSSEKLHTQEEPDNSGANDNASHGNIHAFRNRESEKREALNSVHRADKASQNTIVVEGGDEVSVDTGSTSGAAAWTKDAIEEVGSRRSPTTVTQNPPSQTRMDEEKHSLKSAKVLLPSGQGLERCPRDSAEIEVSKTAVNEDETLDNTIKVTDILTEGKATAEDMRDTRSRIDDSDERENKKSAMAEGDAFGNGPAGTNTFRLQINQPDVSKTSSNTANETILKSHDSNEHSATVVFQHKSLEAEDSHRTYNAKEYDNAKKNERGDDSGEHVAEKSGNPITAFSLGREELMGLAAAMMWLPLSLPQKPTQLKGDCTSAVDDENKQLDDDVSILGKEPEPGHGEDALAENDNDTTPPVDKKLEHTEGVVPSEHRGVLETTEGKDAAAIPETRATCNKDSTVDNTDEQKTKIVPPAPHSYYYGYSEGTCCPVCRQHINPLVYCPVDWAKPLQYPTYAYAIDAIAQHVEECHKNEPIWNIIEAQLGRMEHQQIIEEHKRAMENPGSPPQNCISPQHFCRIALRHAIGCSFAVDESLQDMTKLRDMFIRRLGIARGFVQWSSDYFLYGRTCTNCRGDVVPGYEMRRSALLVLAYLEDHVMENAFNKNFHITEGYALTFPPARWRNMVQSVFLDPKGIENAWFMQDNNDRPYRKK